MRRRCISSWRVGELGRWGGVVRREQGEEKGSLSDSKLEPGAAYELPAPRKTYWELRRAPGRNQRVGLAGACAGGRRQQPASYISFLLTVRTPTQRGLFDTPGACSTKQDDWASWITALSKSQILPKSGTWTKVKKNAVPGFTLCSYPANSEILLCDTGPMKLPFTCVCNAKLRATMCLYLRISVGSNAINPCCFEVAFLYYHLIYIPCHLADAFIQSDLQLIRLSRRHTPWSNVGLRALAQGPNSCADLIVATPGIEPPTLRVQVK